MSTKPGPCPFCGSENTKEHGLDIICHNCGAMGPRRSKEKPDFTAAWNAPGEKIERLEAALESNIEAIYNYFNLNLHTPDQETELTKGEHGYYYPNVVHKARVCGELRELLSPQEGGK